MIRLDDRKRERNSTVPLMWYAFGLAVGILGILGYIFVAISNGSILM